MGFVEIEEIKEEKQTTKNYIKDVWEGVTFIAKSQRLRSLFLYAGISWGIYCLIGTYRTSLLVDIGTPEQVITMIAAVISVAAAIGSKQQLRFHNYFRNKSLATILFMVTFFIILAGLAGIIQISYGVNLAIIITCFVIIGLSKGIGEVLVTRYLGNFASDKILTQIYAINAISRNLFRAIISFLGSYLLRITNTSNSLIMVGILLLITVLGLVSYMKPRLGLKPKEYEESEIYQEVK